MSDPCAHRWRQHGEVLACELCGRRIYGSVTIRESDFEDGPPDVIDQIQAHHETASRARGGVSEPHDAACSGCQILGWMHTAESLGGQLASQDLRINAAIDLLDSAGPDEGLSALTAEMIARTLRGEV